MGNIEGLCAVATDLTERKRYEQIMADEKLVRSILDQAMEAVVVCDVQGRITHANRVATGLCGQNPLLHSFEEMFPLETPTPLLQGLRRGITYRTLEAPMRRPDGSQKDILLTAGPLIGAHQEVLGWIVTLMDITERRRAEEELRRSELRFRMVSRATNDAIWDWNMETGRVEWTENVHTQFGYRPEDVSNDFHWWEERVHPEDRGQVLKSVQQVIDSGGSGWSNEYRFLRADGSYAFVVDRGYVLRDERGRPHRMVGAMLDLTDRKRAEERLRESEQRFRALAEELELRVMERTAELGRAIDELRIANRELESFSYTVSHDLQAPLRAISGMAGILLEDHLPRLDAEGQRLLRNIQKNVGHMSKLIQGLLQFSRLGRQRIEMRTIDMDELTRAVVQEVKGFEPGRRVEVTVHPLSPAVGDRDLIRQVLVNLFTNAFKFTRRTANPRIEIGEFVQEQERVYFVRDNGIGFDERYVDKLFGVFQRLHLQEEFEGTGVGLAIVQRIVQKHGGRTWAKGAPGEGATFYFTLPIPK